MYLAFLDEFGHIGPYIRRNHPSYNQSPVFGLAGYVLPHHQARSFATWFYQLKSEVLKKELAQISVHPATWEKKGSELFTTRNMKKYPRVRDAAGRLLNKIYRLDGKFFYYGREKYKTPEKSNAAGLYTTVMGHTVTQADRYVSSKGSQFLMILDQHRDRIQLLEAAAKTMFGANPARSLIEPPFHVESHLYQTIQAADWVSTLVGRALAYRCRQDQFEEWQWADELFKSKIDPYSTHSMMWTPRRPTSPARDAACTESAPTDAISDGEGAVTRGQ